MSRILEALEFHRSSSPDKAAIFDGRETLRWRQVDVEVGDASRALAGCAAVGLHLKNSPAWIIADLAVMRAGATCVPLPQFFSDAQIAHAVRDARIDTIITDDPARLATLAADVDASPITIAGRRCTRLELAMPRPPPPGASAKVTYTSGSTGTPRGVRLGPAAIETVAASLAVAAGARADDRALALLPLSILLENIGSVYVPILAGATIIVPEPSGLGIHGSSSIDGARFARTLSALRPTTMILPPQLLKLVVGLAQRGVLPDSFRFIAVGGAPTSRALLELAAELGLPVYQGYGLSEACSVVAMNTAAANRPGSVGRPLPHAGVRTDEEGRIFVSGTLFDGYLGDPAGYMASEIDTGDVGYLDDGWLYVVGRSRERIITAYGRNISPEWVESELCAHPLIAQAAVLGSDLPRPVAILVPTALPSGQQPADRIEAAVAEVNARLPDYARIADFAVAAEPFTTGNGELTVGGTPARGIIARHHGRTVAALSERVGEPLL